MGTDHENEAETRQHYRGRSIQDHRLWCLRRRVEQLVDRASARLRVEDLLTPVVRIRLATDVSRPHEPCHNTSNGRR
jgi:hypothetical protein